MAGERRALWLRRATAAKGTYNEQHTALIDPYDDFISEEEA